MLKQLPSRLAGLLPFTVVGMFLQVSWLCSSFVGCKKQLFHLTKNMFYFPLSGFRDFITTGYVFCFVPGGEKANGRVFSIPRAGMWE